MSNAEDLLTHTQTLFRELRAAWYGRVLALTPSEREWEDDEREACRARDNAALKEQYDAQTERLLQGEPLPVTPQCAFDMQGGSDAGNQEKS